MHYYILGHGHCFDGMCSLWVARRQFHNVYPGAKASYHSVTYGGNLPHMEDGSCVIFLDFSLKREDLLRLRGRMGRVIVIDHHDTALKELEGLDDCIFDMSKSGAQLTADFFKERNAFVRRVVDYVADRDLWKFNMYRSHDVNNFISTLPNQMSDDAFTEWQSIINIASNTDALANEMANKGALVTKFKQNLIDNALKRAYTLTLEGRQVLCVNVTPEIASDVLNKLITPQNPVSLGYFVNEKKEYIYSLRSNGSINVADVAKQFGGGGHPKAAGFSLHTPPLELHRHLHWLANI